MSDFGEALKAIRLSRGLTQDAMAELLGTSKQVLSRYETGTRVPKVTVVAEYADKLGVDISVLTGGDQDEDDMWAIRDALRKNPDTRTLFKLARGATPADIKAAIAVLESLKGNRNG